MGAAMHRRGFFATIASAIAGCRCAACAFGIGRHAGAVVMVHPSGRTLCFPRFRDNRVLDRLCWGGYTFTDETRRELDRRIAIGRAKLGMLA